jgi:hypothetical protein
MAAIDDVAGAGRDPGYRVASRKAPLRTFARSATVHTYINIERTFPLISAEEVSSSLLVFPVL